MRGGKASLPPVAREVDAALFKLDTEIDWLTQLSPVGHDELWRSFVESGYREVPPLRYATAVPDLQEIRKTLLDLPIHEIEDPLVETLLIEKQREIDSQIELVRMRGREGFILASIDLFGDVSDRLLHRAQAVLEQVPLVPDAEDDATAADVVAEAHIELDHYRARSATFLSEIVLDSDVDSHLLVSMGDLYVDRDYRLPRARIQPLLQHEVGVHVVTRHNGRQQALSTLECGLADYDTLQEGLAVLSEYLSGYLPAPRLRLLAARVVAAEMAVRERSTADIFHCLVEDHEIDEDDAFQTAVRAKRGGGLTKDALYLKGLVDLLAYLQEGGAFEVLFLGKFALKQLETLQKLMDAGLVEAPELLPRYLENPRVQERLAASRRADVTDLFQKEPQA